MVNGDATTTMDVPAGDGKMRFWRNTSIASLPPGGLASLPFGTLGFEWDVVPDNSVRPAGLIRMSTTTRSQFQVLQDNGSNYGPGIATHSLALYRHSSGALVFGAGTVQWSWGLDAQHDNPGTPVDLRMQQATVNLLADMKVQPATLNSGLVVATASTDVLAPTSTIASPVAGASVAQGTAVTISGSATEFGGGVVGGVEVSVDGGATWRQATGRGSWTYRWTPTTSGTVTIRSRAVDDSGNLETPGVGRTVTVTGQPATCPCTIWPPSAVPAVANLGDPGSLTLGVKFRSDQDGFITGIRFYKGAGSTGTHVATLWSSTGQLLATAPFVSETASGWQQVNFAAPVAITANAVYVASYFAPNGGYAGDSFYFASSGADGGPLHALQDGVNGGNGLYVYGSTNAFPNSTFRSFNYWVDVVFTTSTSLDTTPPALTLTSPANDATSVSTSTAVTALFSEPLDAATVSGATFELRNSSNALVAASVSYNTTTRTATLTPSSALAGSTTYTVTVKGGAADPRVKDLAGNALAANNTWSFTTGASSCPCTIWPASATPGIASNADRGALTVGVKFRSDQNGFITGIRFYKGAGNTGLHIATLWSSGGQQLATAPLASETASGWQQVNFAAPVAITANTVYVASYFAPNGGYAGDSLFFASSGVDNGPLHALQDGLSGGNGLYVYGPTNAFPNSTFRSFNYWVDVGVHPVMELAMWCLRFVVVACLSPTACSQCLQG